MEWITELSFCLLSDSYKNCPFQCEAIVVLIYLATEAYWSALDLSPIFVANSDPIVRALANEALFQKKSLD